MRSKLLVPRTAIAACLLALAGCNSYPPTSEDGYELGRMLYGVCNQRRADQLDAFESLVNVAHREQRISDAERDTLHEIVVVARDGDWQHAAQEAHNLLGAQIDR